MRKCYIKDTILPPVLLYLAKEGRCFYFDYDDQMIYPTIPYNQLSGPRNSLYAFFNYRKDGSDVDFTHG